jgi:hypothetical protein
LNILHLHNPCVIPTRLLPRGGRARQAGSGYS